MIMNGYRICERLQPIFTYVYRTYRHIHIYFPFKTNKTNKETCSYPKPYNLYIYTRSVSYFSRNIELTTRITRHIQSLKYATKMMGQHSGQISNIFGISRKLFMGFSVGCVLQPQQHKHFCFGSCALSELNLIDHHVDEFCERS